MAKSTKFTIEGLEKMGLTKNSDGTYSRKKSVVSNNLFENIDFSLYPDGELVVKQKVNDSPDFEHKINTEWSISYSVPSKKNSRINFVRNGKQISLPSKNHSEYKKMTAMQYSIFGVEFRKAIEHYQLKPPFRVQFTFIRASKHRADFTNLCQTVEDLMVENNWIKDDDMLTLIPSFTPREDDKNNPGVRIKLLTNF